MLLFHACNYCCKWKLVGFGVGRESPPGLCWGTDALLAPIVPWLSERGDSLMGPEEHPASAEPNLPVCS